MNPKVAFFFEKDSQWQEVYQQLRKIILDCGLQEELKWGVPCYTYKKKNIVLMHGFNDYCALLFHKGALLKDSENILIQQTENVQSARQIRFTGINEVNNLKSLIKQYVFEAVEVEKLGIKVPMKKTSEFEVPNELQEKWDADKDFKKAFDALTPGRQRGYLLYFSKAKQSKTRTDRIEKCIPKIYEGKGWNEQ
ncbi:YdeI/OmpD-associated family protein [Galbibacter mesophilus]|uniref:YdeI/OmpD-associated family protein n=1 Tax=Galbibacter mesophilus TaxID=379069 RepID=UPI00191E1719|nr:DUF1801 domain-containing protein [Galbibacter mesophilus]MCM5663186.1 YdeI/OmpD-associated family protein [Galbibacter mesophilus]